MSTGAIAETKENTAKGDLIAFSEIVDVTDASVQQKLARFPLRPQISMLSLPIQDF